MFLEYGKKYFWKGSVFRNFIGRNNFSKASPYFKKMVNSLWQDFEISEIFYVILYLDFQKESVGNPHKVMAKFLEAVVDDVHFIFNLHSFLMPPSLPRQMLPIGKSFAPSQAEQLPKLAPPLNIPTTALVCISFPQLLNS